VTFALEMAGLAGLILLNAFFVASEYGLVTSRRTRIMELQHQGNKRARAVLAIEYVTTSLAMLEKMSPWEYQQIRVVLGHGSGFDSPGFRAVAAATRHAGRAFTAQVEAAGLGLVELYQRGREFEALYQVAEALTDWDERIWIWRFRHYATVARHLGEDTKGTQGTPVAVLGKLIAQRQLPELWHARAALVERFDAGER